MEKLSVTELLINLSAKLILAKSQSEILSISSELNEVAKETIKINSPPKDKVTSTSGILHFTQKEIAQMEIYRFPRHLWRW